MADHKKFSMMVRMKAWIAFKSPEEALENTNDISEGNVNGTLLHFLELNLLDGGKADSGAFKLGVSDEKLGSALKEALGISCQRGQEVTELLRGIRQHFTRFVPELKDGRLEQSHLAMGHTYSRAKVKFNVNRADNMIIQAIATLDQVDKDLNTFSMRIREWYGYLFPELSKLAPDHYTYARLVKLIGDKSSLSDALLPQLAEILNDNEELAQAIVDASKTSMGQDISELDLVNAVRFADRIIQLAEYRLRLHAYLCERMDAVAPSVSALIGEIVGARLIAHSGSLTNLAKCPASTVQILGAEKALFRALKTRGNTPKYGLIFHSTFIGRAAQKNKGRISRYLANKTSIASRLDCFSDEPSKAWGERLREQVEERLKFYESGVAPVKNIDAMREVAAELRGDEPPSRKRKAADREDSDSEEDDNDGGDDHDVGSGKATEKKSGTGGGAGGGAADDAAAKKAAKKAAKAAKKAEKKRRKLNEAGDAAAGGGGDEEKKEKKKKKKEKKEKKEKKKNKKD